MSVPIGQVPRRAEISSVTTALPCVVTTIDNHGYFTDDFIRITDLNSCMPTLRGMDQINNSLFKIEVTSPTTFRLKNPITFEYIDSTGFTPYVTGGRCNLDNHTYKFLPPA